MTPVYVEEGGELRYFIFGLCDDSDVCKLPDIKTIHESAFARHNGIKQIFCGSNLNLIEKEAFKDCKKLEVFCCKQEAEDTIKNIKGIEISSCNNNFTIQSKAFAGCKSLQTVILPIVSNKSNLIIEKDAFIDCESLRMVVVLAKKIDFTENPFGDCPQELTFVCKKGSDVKQFARENGYECINVK